MKLATAAEALILLATLKLSQSTEAALASAQPSSNLPAVRAVNGGAAKAADSAGRPMKDIKTAIKERNAVDFSAKKQEALLSVEKSNKPDVNFISSRKQQVEARELQAGTCAEFVRCNNGNEVYEDNTPTGRSCYTACGGLCCTTASSCKGSTSGFTGKVCKDGSCDGHEACSSTSIDEVISSCTGNRSCIWVNLSRAVGSCQGLQACLNLNTHTSNIDMHVIRSCNNERACFDASYYGSVASITDSCNGSYSCYGMAFDNHVGEVKGSCNGAQSCYDLEFAQPVDILSCCNNDYECKDIVNVANLASECATDSPDPDVDTLPELESNAAALSLNKCVINDVSESSVLLQCTFNSTDGVSAKGQIVEGSCSDNNDFKIEATSAVTTDATITASTDFGPSITAAEKNSDSFAKPFCARADVLADNNGSLVSIGVEKVNIVATMSFSNTGNFDVIGIDITPVTIEDTAASATRLAQISADLGPCGGAGKASYRVGERVEICISSDDSNAEITAIKSVSVVNPSTALVGSDGVANALTNIGSLPSATVTLGTLIIAAYDDSGAGSITISGTADVSYVNRRTLKEMRKAQEEQTSFQEFSLKVPLISAEGRPSLDDTDNSAVTESYGISFLMLMVIFGVY